MEEREFPIYRKYLEALRIEYQDSTHVSMMGRRMRILQFVVDAMETIKVFEKLKKDLQNKIVLDADKDVDYSYWSTYDAWKRPGNASMYMAKPFEVEEEYIESVLGIFYDPDGENRSNKSMEKTLRMMSSVEELSDEELEKAQVDVLSNLLKLLCEIKNILQRMPEPCMYDDLYEDYNKRFGFSSSLRKANDEFNKWQDEYVGELDSTAYGEHLADAFSDLCKTNFLYEGTPSIGDSTLNQYSKEFLFKALRNKDNDDRLLKLYAHARKMMQSDGATLTPAPRYVGKFFFVQRGRLSEWQIMAFFQFAYVCRRTGELLNGTADDDVKTDSNKVLKARATEAMVKHLGGAKGSLARGFDINKLILAFKRILGQTPESLPLLYQPLSEDLWNDFLLVRRRCTPEPAGFIKITFLNILGYWKSKGMIQPMTNAQATRLFIKNPSQSEIDNFKNGISGNNTMAKFKPLLDYGLDIMKN